MLAQFALSRIYFWPWASSTVYFTKKLEAFRAISAFYYAGEFDWLCQPYVLQIGQIIRFKMDSVWCQNPHFYPARIDPWIHPYYGCNSFKSVGLQLYVAILHSCQSGIDSRALAFFCPLSSVGISWASCFFPYLLLQYATKKSSSHTRSYTASFVLEWSYFDFISSLTTFRITYLFFTIGKISMFRSSREYPNIGSRLSLCNSSFCAGCWIRGNAKSERFFEALNDWWISASVLTPCLSSSLQGRRLIMPLLTSWSSTMEPLVVSTRSILPGRKRPCQVENSRS